jgi:hypothetical protein
MRRFFLLGICLFTVACSSAPREAKPVLTPGSRLIFHNGEMGMWSICDRGSRVFLTDRGTMFVVQGGCPDGNP